MTIVARQRRKEVTETKQRIDEGVQYESDETLIKKVFYSLFWLAIFFVTGLLLYKGFFNPDYDRRQHLGLEMQDDHRITVHYGHDFENSATFTTWPGSMPILLGIDKAVSLIGADDMFETVLFFKEHNGGWGVCLLDIDRNQKWIKQNLSAEELQIELNRMRAKRALGMLLKR